MTERALIFVARFAHALHQLAPDYKLDVAACDRIASAMLMQTDVEALDLWADAPEVDIRESARIRIEHYIRAVRMVS